MQRSSLKIPYRLNEHDLALLKPLKHTRPISIDAGQLLEIFSRLHRRQMLVASSDRFLSLYRWRLRDELFLLPDDVNPLVWLRENHLQYAALSVLAT